MIFFLNLNANEWIFFKISLILQRFEQISVTIFFCINSRAGLKFTYLAFVFDKSPS